MAVILKSMTGEMIRKKMKICIKIQEVLAGIILNILLPIKVLQINGFNINLGFFDDYASSNLPLASFNTDSIKLIAGKNEKFMNLVYDKYKYSSLLEFDLNKVEKIGIYNLNLTLVTF